MIQHSLLIHEIPIEPKFKDSYMRESTKTIYCGRRLNLINFNIMRHFFLLLIVSAILHNSSLGQWVNSGNNVYIDNGNVGVGVVNPQYRLELYNEHYDNFGTQFLQRNRVISTLTTTQSAPNYLLALDMDVSNMKISAGVTDNGYRLAGRFQAFAKNSGFVGTLNTQYGLWSRVGIDNATSGAKVVNAYGLYAEVLNRISGTEITNSYGVYIKNSETTGNIIERYDLYASSSNAKNYFAGTLTIGTTSLPATDAKLAVNGNIYARKLKVTQTGWPDYVFDPVYKLRTLKEVEAFIRTHHHLPDMPSAKEVESQGLDVGDNQAALLRKIEELTLYIIDQEKRLKSLESQAEELTRLKEILNKIQVSSQSKE